MRSSATSLADAGIWDLVGRQNSGRGTARHVAQGREALGIIVVSVAVAAFVGLSALAIDAWVT